MHQQNQKKRKYAFSSLYIYIYMGAVVTWIRDLSGFWLHDSKKKVPEFFLTLFGANSLNVIDILWIILQWYSVHAFTIRNWNCHFLNFSYLETGLKKHYPTVVTVPISSILTMFMLLFQKSENLWLQLNLMWTDNSTYDLLLQLDDLMHESQRLNHRGCCRQKIFSCWMLSCHDWNYPNTSGTLPPSQE